MVFQRYFDMGGKKKKMFWLIFWTISGEKRAEIGKSCEIWPFFWIQYNTIQYNTIQCDFFSVYFMVFQRYFDMGGKKKKMFWLIFWTIGGEKRVFGRLVGKKGRKLGKVAKFGRFFGYNTIQYNTIQYDFFSVYFMVFQRYFDMGGKKKIFFG